MCRAAGAHRVICVRQGADWPQARVTSAMHPLIADVCCCDGTAQRTLMRRLSSHATMHGRAVGKAARRQLYSAATADMSRLNAQACTLSCQNPMRLPLPGHSSPCSAPHSPCAVQALVALHHLSVGGALPAASLQAHLRALGRMVDLGQETMVAALGALVTVLRRVRRNWAGGRVAVPALLPTRLRAAWQRPCPPLCAHFGCRWICQP